MNYKGVIIEESLVDSSIINELKVLEVEVAKTTAKEATPWLDKWTLKTVEINENEIDFYTKKLSQLIDTKHIGNWYCDFRNNTSHYIVFSNKIFRLNRKSKQDYIDMQKYALSIGLPKHQLPNYNDLPESLLIGFIIDAKKNTYANGNASKVNSTRLNSHDYEYKEEVEGEEMIYHDTYFGGLNFIGEEVVYRNNEPKWAMNYYGNTIDESLSENAMDKVLRPALMQVGLDSILPLRGPRLYINGDYKYTFEVEGTIENFNGIEQIYMKDKLIYKLTCHGGIIED